MENQAGSAAHHPARTPALRSCSIGSEENSLDQEFLVLVVNFSFPDPCWEWPFAGASRSGKFLKFLSTSCHMCSESHHERMPS